MTTDRPQDDEIRAEEVKRGDELHLTVMGGDEYVTVEHKRSYRGMTTLRWTSWGGPIEDKISNAKKVWIKKRDS